MSTSARELIIYGAGGIGREVVSMAESGCHGGRDMPPWHVIGLVDDTPEFRGKSIHGITCLGSFEETEHARAGKETFCHIAIGNNESRSKAAARLETAGWNAATVVHSKAYVSWEVDLGAGSFVGLGVTISPNVTIGRHVLINTYATIGHDVTIGDFAQVSLGASILGNGHIERGAMIGAQAVIMSNTTVGAWATVAVGTPVLRNVKPGHTVSLPLAKTLYKRDRLPD